MLKRKKLLLLPELGAGDDLVLGEELQLVDLRDRVLLRRGGAADDLVVVHASLQRVLLDLAHSLLHHFEVRVWGVLEFASGVLYFRRTIPTDLIARCPCGVE